MADYLLTSNGYFTERYWPLTFYYWPAIGLPVGGLRGFIFANRRMGVASNVRGDIMADRRETIEVDHGD